MRIIVMTDVHANLPALEAAVDVIRRIGYDVLYHAGDAIAIGPFPREVLELLAEVPSAQFVQGNHEVYFVRGLPSPQPQWMTDGEVAHQRWTHEQLSSTWKEWITSWPYQLEEDHDRVLFTVMHYGLRGPNGDFASIIREPTAAHLDAMFTDVLGALVCYGHVHRPSDITGHRRYINVGSLGCAPRAVARFAVIDVSGGDYTVRYEEVEYDDASLYEAFESRRVPEREFIYGAFYGGRFGSRSAKGA